MQKLTGIFKNTSLNSIKSIDKVKAILDKIVQDYISDTLDTTGEDLNFGDGIIGYDNEKQLIQDFFDYAKSYFDLKESK